MAHRKMPGRTGYVSFDTRMDTFQNREEIVRGVAGEGAIQALQAGLAGADDGGGR